MSKRLTVPLYSMYAHAHTLSAVNMDCEEIIVISPVYVYCTEAFIWFQNGRLYKLFLFNYLGLLSF